MALSLRIEQPDGTIPSYWRVVNIPLVPGDGIGRIVLGGYISAEIRHVGGGYVASREYRLDRQQFARLATAPALPVTDAQRALIEAHADGAPPVVADFLRSALALTTFDAIARPAYAEVRAARRPCQIDPDTGEGIAPDGTRYPADQIVMIGDVPTVPSEFADAVAV